MNKKIENLYFILQNKNGANLQRRYYYGYSSNYLKKKNHLLFFNKDIPVFIYDLTHIIILLDMDQETLRAMKLYFGFD